MLALDRIEAAATSARLAGHHVKSVWIAALYTPAHVVATVVWTMPAVESDPTEPLKGVTQTVIARPSDTTMLIGTGAAAAIEAQILGAAWALGAWDVRRTERAPLSNPDEWAMPRHGLGASFGMPGYVIAGTATNSGEHAEHEAIQRAAREGYVVWHFVPLALGAPSMRSKWAGKDKSLADDCTRGARSITPGPLAGQQQPGHGHEHIYQLGRAPHGNRSKSAASDRRG